MAQVHRTASITRLDTALLHIRNTNWSRARQVLSMALTAVTGGSFGMRRSHARFKIQRQSGRPTARFFCAIARLQRLDYEILAQRRSKNRPQYRLVRRPTEVTEAPLHKFRSIHARMVSSHLSPIASWPVSTPYTAVISRTHTFLSQQFPYELIG